MSMIAHQVEIDQIRSARVRRRELYLPVCYGEFGERKRCPVRVGRAYELRPPVQYAVWKGEAMSQPSRSRAILWLIDRCLQPMRTVTITVTSVEQRSVDNESFWFVTFTKGDQTGRQDKPRFLAAKPGAPHGDYVGSSALGLPGEREAVHASVLEQYTKDADARRSHAEWEPVHGAAERIATELPGMRKEITVMRERLKRRGVSDRQLEMEIERLEKASMLMEGALGRMRDRLAAAA